MSSWVFVELPPSLKEWVEDGDALFPVRPAEAEAVQTDTHPHPEGILHNLEAYIQEQPEKAGRFRNAGGQLAFRAAVELFTNGLKHESLPFYELSLRLNPDDLTTRLNYAIALHALLDRDGALVQYEEMMRRTTPKEYPRAWVLAGQIHLYRKDYDAVVRLLEPVALEYDPPDMDFWATYGAARTELRERSQKKEPVCRSCSAALLPGMRFCGQCGARLT